MLIREATKQGYAVAEEGDSININFPSSKTRRGRVGKESSTYLNDSVRASSRTTLYSS